MRFGMYVTVGAPTCCAGTVREAARRDDRNIQLPSGFLKQGEQVKVLIPRRTAFLRSAPDNSVRTSLLREKRLFQRFSHVIGCQTGVLDPLDIAQRIAVAGRDELTFAF
ncbi:hypothetical protein GCM10011614_32270 [Novosphingobium colocasiae]|uniref:Uncharacterized protein n=1 Tax=Novosphingobium colocasiae TaxID=1256513 RepID=A0A918UJP5_9SPHN|nr:hypothetical protein GCM10011614_32270 [Novosphingobium colocasiae]